MESIKLKVELNELYALKEFINKTHELTIPIELAVEELFVNIASYAYRPADGPVTIQLSFEGDSVSVVFIDGGRPYNPWEREDPDTRQSGHGPSL